MDVATERNRSRHVAFRIVGVTLAFLLFSMCTTFRPAGGRRAGTAVPAAERAASSKTASSEAAAPASSASVPMVSSLPTVASPPGSGFPSLLPPAGELPTPALPVSAEVPLIPEPQEPTSLPATTLPNAALVGGGEAIAGAAGPTGGESPSGVVEQHPSVGSNVAKSGRYSGGVSETMPTGGGAVQPPASREPRSGVPSASPARAALAERQGSTRAAGSAAASSGLAAREGGGGGAASGPTPQEPSAATAGPSSAAVSTAEAGAARSVAVAPAPARRASPTPARPPAHAAAPAPAEAAAAASQSAAAHEVARKVYAQVGDDITIALKGGGWTFTGGGSSGELWKHGVRYETRTMDASGTTFSFKATALGRWILEFQQQDASTGTTKGERVNVDVLTKQEFARALAAKQPAGSSIARGGASGPELAAADWLYKEGKYTEALDAYEKAWSPGEPALTDKIAELAYRVGHYRDAHDYWQKNFGMHGTVYGDLAVAGLMKTATAERDAPELRALFDSIHALPGLPNSSDLLSAARYLVEAKQWEVAERYLEEYLRRYNGGPGADVADYLLGQIYEGDTPMQNARKALEYYREIVDRYPTSAYYDRARANIVYLRRQFFEIR